MMVNESLRTIATHLRADTWPLLAYIEALEEAFQRREPEVLAFVPEPGRFTRLRQEAKQLLNQYPQPKVRPLLFGVPIGVKDIFHVAGFTTGAGTAVPTHLFQGDEADSVRRLKAAGALILGKTVTTEFAYFAPGPTRNPYHLAHTPGGSSSGSAAAVAAGLSPLTLGTQTIGSINRPATFCGVVGYKPTYNRINKENVLPLAPSVDHVGLFVPTVADVSVGASLLCLDWQTISASQSPILGIPEGPYLERAEMVGLNHLRTVAARLRAKGFIVKSIPALLDFEAIYQRHNLIVAAEAAQVHGTWFAQYASHYHYKTVELIERGQGVAQDTLEEALHGRTQLREQLTALMAEYDFDLWLSPPAPGVAPKGLDSTGDPVMNLPWTHAGLPTLTIPAGFDQNGLPLGVQLTGGWYGDEKMLAWGGMIEQVIREDFGQD